MPKSPNIPARFIIQTVDVGMSLSLGTPRIQAIILSVFIGKSFTKKTPLMD